jgi:hypothetical protein
LGSEKIDGGNRRERERDFAEKREKETLQRRERAHRRRKMTIEK